MSKTKIQTSHGSIYEQFGKNIARCRADMGLSQSEAAARLDMPQSTYSGYESGTRKIPLSVIVQLADFYGKTPDELINGKSEALTAAVFELTELEKQIILRFRALPDGERNMLLRSLGLEEKGENGGFSVGAV